MKGYSMKKRVIAFVLAIAVIFGSNGFYSLMEVVRAEENTNPNLVTVTKVELLNNGSTEVSPGVLRFAISGRAREDISVSEIELSFTGASRKVITMSYRYEDSTSYWIPGTEGSTKQFSVSLPDYVGNQKYELTSVRLISSGSNHVYTEYRRENSASGYTDVFNGRLATEPLSEPIRFSYDRGADFTVIGSQPEDSVAPTIQSIERIAPADGEQITPDTSVIYRVNYVEIGAGIQDIEVAFYNGSFYDTFHAEFPEPYRGELTLTTTYRNLGDYELQYINIIDYAQNTMRYEWRELQGIKTFGWEQYTPTYEFVPVGDDFFINDAEAYSVVIPSSYKGLKVTSVNLEADEDTNVDGKQLHAGQTYTAHVTVKNDGVQSANVDPTRLRMGWAGFAEGGARNLDTYGVGDTLTLMSGESVDIQVPFTVNQYWPAVDLTLNSIYLNYDKEAYSWDMFYSADNQYFSGYNGEYKWVDTLHNTACSADFSVIPGEHMDTDAPMLGSLSATSESFKAPGRATLQMTMSEEEGAKFDHVLFMLLVDVNNPENMIDINMESNPTYHAMRIGMYLYSFDLPNTVFPGTYAIKQIVYYDESGNSREYMLTNDKLVDMSDNQNQISGCRFNVESENTDADFDYPIIKDIQLNASENSIIAGEQIEFELEVEEESGLSSVWLDYSTGGKSDHLYLDANNGTKSIEEIPAVNDGCHRYRLKAWTKKYCLEEAYILTGISVCDNSVRYNGCYYQYDGINKTYVLVNTANDEHPITFTPNKELGLTVRLPQGMYLAKADDMQSAIQSLPSDATTLVVTKDDQDVSLSGNDLKDKNVDIIVPDATETSEIQISSELFKGTNGLDNLILNVQRDGLVEEEVAADSEDDMYYPVYVVSSEKDIAVTLCIRLDEEFLSQCGENEIAIYDEEGNIIQSGLVPNERGEVTIELAKLEQDKTAPILFRFFSRRATTKTHEFRVASKKASSAGNNPDGNNPGGNNQGGNSQGGNSQGGNNQAGNNQGGSVPGSNASQNQNSSQSGANVSNTTTSSDNASVSQIPNTGDTSSVGVTFAVMMFSAAICVALINQSLIRKKLNEIFGRDE